MHEPNPMQNLLAAYLACRECSPRYRSCLTRTVKQAGLGGITSVSDLTTAQVNKFLQNLSSPSATTRSNVRRELLTLWRWAFEERLTDVPPLRVMKIRSRPRPPTAWSLQELSRMLECAESDETRIGGKSTMRVCDYMPCWIGVSYDTGLRFSDVHALKTTQVRNGYVCCTAQKTGKALTRPLSSYSLHKVTQLAPMSLDGTLFTWFLTRRRAFTAMRAFLDRYGFSGSGKFLRRSCATYIEAESPGMATRYLQHSEPSLARRHYVDESLLAVPSGPPPIMSLNSGAR